jgi:hypothetical protein
MKSENIQQVTKHFLSFYEKGFEDKKFFVDERDYKENASRIFMQSLNQPIFSELLNQAEYKKICDACSEATSLKYINLLHIIAWKQMKDMITYPDNQKPFSETLYALLYGGNVPEYFDKFCSLLRRLGILSWPRATVFLFLFDYKTYLCVRPLNIKAISKIFDVPIDYHPIPTWARYKTILHLADVIKSKLTESSNVMPFLKPKDMIDINSFIYMSQVKRSPA